MGLGLLLCCIICSSHQLLMQRALYCWYIHSGVHLSNRCLVLSRLDEKDPDNMAIYDELGMRTGLVFLMLYASVHY